MEKQKDHADHILDMIAELEGANPRFHEDRKKTPQKSSRKHDPEEDELLNQILNETSSTLQSPELKSPAPKKQHTTVLSPFSPKTNSNVKKVKCDSIFVGGGTKPMGVNLKGSEKK